MKRAGGLWPKLTSLENLFEAARQAAKGKRSRPDVARYMMEIENEAPRLQRLLISGEYMPGPYRTFQVRDPKPRTISAAPFPDRVVHHALTRIFEPVFENRFSPYSYACRKGLGAHLALERAAQGCRAYRYVLKCDVRKYFASIDHEILNDRLRRVVKCRRSLDLASRIIDASNPQEPANVYFGGDDLFTPFQRRRGLPLGNQTSQFFANVYLDPLDQLATRVLQTPYYVRYVDDFICFGNEKSRLRDILGRFEDLLSSVRLRLHDGKSRIYRVRDGVTFLGWRMFPEHRRLVRSNVVRFRRRLRRLQRSFAEGSIDWQTLDCRVLSWIAHARHGDTWRLRERIFDAVRFRRGSSA